MTDETLPDDLQDLMHVEVDTDSRAEFHEYSGGPNGGGGVIIFPHGSDVFAETVEALAIRIADKTGDIEILEAGKGWRDVAKPVRVGTVAAVK